MNTRYDASKEFTPFANRGKGGALLEEPTFKGHPNKKNFRRRAGKPNASTHSPNRRVRVCTVSGSPYMGYHYEKA